MQNIFIVQNRTEQVNSVVINFSIPLVPAQRTEGRFTALDWAAPVLRKFVLKLMCKAFNESSVTLVSLNGPFTEVSRVLTSNN